MPDTIINWVAVRAMPEFMTNLRVACLKLRGGVGNSTLLNPDLFRKEAVRRGISVFESDSNCNEVPEDQISKGDAGYQSAWIDKLLGDCEESEAGSDQSGSDTTGHLGQSREQERSRQGIVNLLHHYSYFTFYFIIRILLYFASRNNYYLPETFYNVQTQLRSCCILS